MTNVFGVFDPQAFVVLIIACIGLLAVARYYEQTSRWLLYAFGCLFFAAFATNFEYVFLPNVLNVAEHVVGNMGAGIAFALAAYMYRKEHILADDAEAAAEPTGLEGEP